MAVKLVLLHSPLVGPGTWRLLAPALVMRGFQVVVPDYSAVMRGEPPYYLNLVRTARAAIAPDDSAKTILIGHSGAGALLPAIAEGGLVHGAIFMDALLPHPALSWFATAPDSLNKRLMSLARDGQVPPWHQWWPQGAVAAMFSRAADYEQFAAELHTLPIGYFNEAAPEIALPENFPSAYLQLGPGCAAEAGLAESWGWPVLRAALHHLAMLTHADVVGAQTSLLVEALVPQLR
jgi:hypothetical protein